MILEKHYKKKERTGAIKKINSRRMNLQKDFLKLKLEAQASFQTEPRIVNVSFSGIDHI